MTQKTAEEKAHEQQIESLRKAIGLLNNRLVATEQKNRALDAHIRRLTTEVQQLKSKIMRSDQ